MLYVALCNSDMQHANCASVLAIWSITSQPLRPLTPTPASFFLCVSPYCICVHVKYLFSPPLVRPSCLQPIVPIRSTCFHSSSQHFTFSLIFEGLGDFSLKTNFIFQRITRGQSDTDPCSKLSVLEPIIKCRATRMKIMSLWGFFILGETCSYKPNWQSHKVMHCHSKPSGMVNTAK